MKSFEFSRSLTSALLAITMLAATAFPATANARLAAVIVLKSTAVSHVRAVSASKALALRIAEQPGWDARVIDARGRTAADAAAAIGAEIYVIGQYVDGTPAHVSGSALKVSTEERLGDFSYDVIGTGSVPQSVSFAELLGSAPSVSTTAGSSSRSQTLSSVTLPSGDLISVVMLKDIGSRISQEGETFPVVTAEDYYYKGLLILPKGSPGYGTITHLKGAGSFHAGGELNFTVKRLVTPTRTDITVETNGATADADKITEQNGNAFGQYLLWGVGMFAKRGNDILIKKGTLFHVSTVGSNVDVPVASQQAQPAALDPAAQVVGP